MRIISPFHDYYDSAMGLGVDRSLVFVRQPGELSEDDGRHFAMNPSSGAGGTWSKGHWTEVAARPFWLGIAGKRYKGVLCELFDVSATASPELGRHKILETTCAYSFEAYASQLNKHGHDIAESNWRGFGPRRVRTRSRREERETLDRRRRWFESQGEDIAAQMGSCGLTVIAQERLDRLSRRREDWGGPIQINPQLSRFQFYRVMQPWEVFQELSMWVGGVLPQREAMAARVSDADRFVEHGFDAKTSFRGARA